MSHYIFILNLKLQTSALSYSWSHAKQALTQAAWGVEIKDFDHQIPTYSIHSEM